MNGRRAVKGCRMCQWVAGGKVQAGGMLTLAVIAVSTVLTAIAVVPVIPLPVIAVTTSAMSASSSGTLSSRGRWRVDGLPAVRRSRTVASVTAVAIIVAVTLATVILARRVVASAPGAGSPAARRARRATVAVTPRIEAPGRRRRSAGPLQRG